MSADSPKSQLKQMQDTDSGAVQPAAVDESQELDGALCAKLDGYCTLPLPKGPIDLEHLKHALIAHAFFTRRGQPCGCRMAAAIIHRNSWKSTFNFLREKTVSRFQKRAHLCSSRLEKGELPRITAPYENALPRTLCAACRHPPVDARHRYPWPSSFISLNCHHAAQRWLQSSGSVASAKVLCSARRAKARSAWERSR